MKKSTEMRKNLESLKNAISQLQAEGKIDEAHNKLKELADMRNAIEVQEALELEEVENFAAETALEVTNKADHLVAFNKAVLGRKLTEAENALVEKTDEDGGYLVPKEQKTQIEELKRQLIPLKQYCNVIMVGTKSGSMPLEVEADDELTNFEEMGEIAQSTIKFGNVCWNLADYGDIIPLSNQLLQDEKANLTNYVGRRFAKKAVRTENNKIITLLKTAAKKTGSSHEALKTALNKELDPAIAASAIIITNQDGFDYLDSLNDGNGRPLLTASLADQTQKMYKGRRIVVLPNGSLKSTSGKLTYFVGDMTEFISFFDRGVYEMAVSKEAGFTKNATMMRVVERFDVAVIDSKAMVQVEITPAAEPTA